MVFVDFALDLKSLIGFEGLFVHESLGLESHVDFHHCLVVDVMLISDEGILILLWRNHPLVFDRSVGVKQVLLTHTEDVEDWKEIVHVCCDIVVV